MLQVNSLLFYLNKSSNYIKYRRTRNVSQQEDTMSKAYAVVKEVAEEHSIDMRTAAFVLAIRRVGAVAKARMYVKEEIRL